MNCLALIDTRLMIPPSEDDATGRFCVEYVAIPEIPLFARWTPISFGPVGTLTTFKTSATESSDFWRFPMGDTQNCHYKRGLGLRNGHKSRIFPRVSPSALACAHRSRSSAFRTNATLAGRSPSRRMK